MALTNLKKKIIGTATLVGAIVVLAGYIVKPFSWYSEYIEEKELQEKQELKTFIIDVFNDVSNGVIKETTREIETTKNLLDSLETIISEIKEGSEYFAVGFRGNGTGKLWYRDMYGNIHELYYWEETNQYYYINDEGRAVYL